jgi:hypothetical protein
MMYQKNQMNQKNHPAPHRQAPLHQALQVPAQMNQKKKESFSQKMMVH